jgi:uncharacterized protein (TIGR03083 family)
MSEEQATSYKELRERVTGFVGDAGPLALDAPSPATPEWCVRELLAHVVGVTNDIVNGRMEGIASDPWTEAQVDPRRGATLDELFAEWDEFSPRFEAMLAAAPPDIAGQALFDGATHEHDLRHALGIPGARESTAIALGWTWMLGMRQRNGAPTICFVTEYETVTVGDGEPVATVEASRFELLRAASGRRSASEIERYTWKPGAEPEILLGAPIFSLRTVPLDE